MYACTTDCIIQHTLIRRKKTSVQLRKHTQRTHPQSIKIIILNVNSSHINLSVLLENYTL